MTTDNDKKRGKPEPRQLGKSKGVIEIGKSACEEWKMGKDGIHK